MSSPIDLAASSPKSLGEAITHQKLPEPETMLDNNLLKQILDICRIIGVYILAYLTAFYQD